LQYKIPATRSSSYYITSDRFGSCWKL